MADDRVPSRNDIDGASGRFYAPDDDGRVRGSDIAVLRDRARLLWENTQSRAQDARDMLAGDLRAPLPKNFLLADAESFRIDMPAKYTEPLKLFSLIQKRRPVAKRPPTSQSLRSQVRASQIEQIVEAVAAQRYPFDDVAEISVNEGIAFVVTLPATAFWQKMPDLRDAEGLIKAQYQRDKRGRAEDDLDEGEALEVDEAASAAAYEQDKRDWIANNLPLVQRTFGPRDAIPIWGPGHTLDGLIVASRYTRLDLVRRGFRWGDGSHLTPIGNDLSMTSSTAGQELELLEYYGTDIHGTPYVSYSVSGQVTWMGSGDDEPEDATIDLSPYIGRLPVAMAPGLHWSASDPDQRYMPFSWPFMRSWLAADAIMSGVSVALWRAGFPSFGYTVDPQAPPEIWLDQDRPREFTWEPLKVYELPGPVTRMPGGDVSPDAHRLVQLLLGQTEQNSVPNAAFGEGGSSGFAQTIARAYAEDAYFQIVDGIRRCYGDAMSHALEILSNVARIHHRVWVYYVGDIAVVDAAESVSDVRTLIELTPALCGGQYGLLSEYRRAMSPAERQQSAELVERRLKTRRQHFEDDGDPAPETTEVMLRVQDYESSEIGQQQMMELVARVLNNEQMAEQTRLQQQGRVDQNGMPVAMAQGLMAPPSGGPMPGMGPPPGLEQVGTPNGGPMSGFGGPTIAQAALAGQIGGQMMAGPINNAMQAGGAVPPEMMGAG